MGEHGWLAGMFTMAAAAASLICEELPAVTVPCA